MKRIIRFSAYLLTAAVLLSMSSCEKDRVSILTDGMWQFENITTSSDDDNIKAIVAGIKAVFTDGTLQFFSDGTYQMEFPLIDDETGSWELVGQSQLVFNIDGGGIRTASIEEISKKELSYIETLVDLDQNSFNTTTTWVK